MSDIYLLQGSKAEWTVSMVIANGHFSLSHDSVGMHGLTCHGHFLSHFLCFTNHAVLGSQK